MWMKPTSTPTRHSIRPKCESGITQQLLNELILGNSVTGAQIQETLNFVGEFVDKHGVLVFVFVLIALAITSVIILLSLAVIKGMSNDTKLIDLSTKRDVELSVIKKNAEDIKDNVDDIRRAFNSSLLANGELMKAVDHSSAVSEAAQSGFKESLNLVVHSLNDNSSTLGEMGGSIIANSKSIGVEIITRVDKLPVEVATEVVGQMQAPFAQVGQGIIARFDKVTGPLANIQNDVAHLVTTLPGGNDEQLAQRVADRVLPQLLTAIKNEFQECLNLATDMAKELDLVENKITPTLSLVDGEINRKIIEGLHPDPDDHNPPPTGAIDPATGEARHIA